MLVAQMFGATGYVIEEKYMDDFDDLDPQYFTGIQGLVGLLIWLVILPIL